MRSLKYKMAKATASNYKLIKGYAVKKILGRSRGNFKWFKREKVKTYMAIDFNNFS